MLTNRILVLALLLAVATASFVSFAETEMNAIEAEAEIEAEVAETEADSLDEVALDPSIVKLRREDANDDEMVMRSFEEVASNVEASIAKPNDPEMVEHMHALEALEAEVEHDNEQEENDNAFLESHTTGPAVATADLIAKVDEALKANDASFGIGDMAKDPPKKVFPKIGKGDKTLVSEMALAKVKDDIAPALNRKKSAISEVEDLEKESEKFIAKWEKDNGGHFCKKKKVDGGPCAPPAPSNAPPIPGAEVKPNPANAPAPANATATAVTPAPAPAPAPKFYF
jgi:hypothetical protein